MSNTGSPLEYVRRYYKVPAEIGRRVTVNGKPGTIIADRGNYIAVNFDHCKPGKVDNCHPTDQVVYLEEIREPRKMTRSQARYQRWLEVGDCFESFKHFLQYESTRKEAA